MLGVSKYPKPPSGTYNKGISKHLTVIALGSLALGTATPMSKAQETDVDKMEDLQKREIILNSTQLIIIAKKEFDFNDCLMNKSNRHCSKIFMWNDYARSAIDHG